MHSKGHTVYNNTISNCKISGITAYGSADEVIFNNSISGSRIGILLGGGYSNVTIGANSFNLDFLPYPPTFVTYIARAETKYQSVDDVMRTYSDKETVTIDAYDVVGYKDDITFTLIGQNGEKLANQDVVISINGVNFTAKTDENSTALISPKLTTGVYTATITFAGNDNYAKTIVNKTLTVKDDRIKTSITASNKNIYLTTIVKGYSYSITLKDVSGKVLANKKVTVTFNGKTYTATTNSKGVATFKVKATTTGSKKATIKFAGDDYYAPITKTTTLKVIKQPTKITAYKKTFKVRTKVKSYTITLKNSNGKVVSKAKVYLKIKGKTYKAYTNSKGKATFKITKLTTRGKYTATIKFSGSKYYSATSKKVYITTKR